MTIDIDNASIKNDDQMQTTTAIPTPGPTAATPTSSWIGLNNKNRALDRATTNDHGDSHKADTSTRATLARRQPQHQHFHQQFDNHDDGHNNNTKKRKSSNNVPPLAPTKKQKSSGAPAIPTQTNSIRNICMRHWNQLQPGGQGTAAHFDAYYKALLDAEKEPFKKQMYIGRGATRKANAAANKGNAASTSS
ncbi:hypothetical protein EDB83DRAFT_2518517 [Lactarius deliciosus]|nr:hypothetical protein EDB83DRAFT_2518517 [Lactarius deliciosus]